MADGPGQQEFLALTAGSFVQRRGGCRSIDIQNLGPNAIWANIGGAAAVATKSHQILTGATWSIDLPAEVQVHILASTANQVTGAATIITEAT